ncbi:kinase-like protein [Leucogyrophana mollusca]|uniref:Kinase-like protein n=1 Tax=Leucogyrophana mollusca TaxID=85980 RepID=A0ACB8B2Q5_9AGAM|nr:kinase-like protein [Leucogyrophana mollusca]
MECLGDTLEALLRASGGVLSVDKVYTIGRALIKTLRGVHEKGYVHRDVKPDNLMLPVDGSLEPYLVDFGDAKRYEELEVGEYESFGAVGTVPFMSVNVHKGMRHGRRDDMVSLAYTLIYLAHGTLPWYGCKDGRQCAEQKRDFVLSRLSPPVPSALQSFLDHAQSLGFDDQPDYSYLENQLRLTPEP